jgi:CubicO group peptidase (beta-lactamase class C family)
MLSPGTFGHGGAHGTQFWIDMKRGVTLIMMIQRSNFKNADESPVELAFQKAALIDRCSAPQNGGKVGVTCASD